MHLRQRQRRLDSTSSVGIRLPRECRRIATACDHACWAKAELFFLDGNAVVIDVDFDATRVLPVLIELIAQYQGGDADRAGDEVENVAFHRLVILFHFRLETSI